MVDGVELITIKELEEEAVRRIEALDSSAFHFSELTGTQGWREAREPLTAVESTAGNSHLAFSASVEDAPVGDDDSGNPSGLWLTSTATLVVVFLYKLPATERVAAMRLATEAARSIVGALLAPWPEVSVTCRNRYRPGKPDADGFLPVECRFSVEIDEPIWTP